MLQKLTNYVVYALGEALQILVNFFMKWLALDTGRYLTYFPALEKCYYVFRGLGIGLTAIIAAVSLIKFYQPEVLGGTKTSDTPAGVLVKSMFAGALVYGGNRILEYIIDIAKVPYDEFLQTDAVTASLSFNAESFRNLFLNIAAERSSLQFGISFLEMLLTMLVAWNLFKLMIEVCERYMMVGIMLFTSPPFFAMFASKDTMSSFKKWLKMFISACVMMFVSVFFFKLILSGFSITAETTGSNALGATALGKMILVLAACKIAQRADSYLKQIGLGTAPTGGNLLEDMIATTRTMSGLGFGGGSGSVGGGSKASVLGQAASSTGYGSGAGRIMGAMGSAASAASNTTADFKKVFERMTSARKAPQPKAENGENDIRET